MKNEERLSKKLGCGESHEEDEAGSHGVLQCAIFSTRKIEEDFTMISFQYSNCVWISKNPIHKVHFLSAQGTQALIHLAFFIHHLVYTCRCQLVSVSISMC